MHEPRGLLAYLDARPLPSTTQEPTFTVAGMVEQIAVLQRAGHPDPSAVGPPLAEVSSTEVRRRLQSGVGAEELVPHAVLAYVRKHGLYRA